VRPELGLHYDSSVFSKWTVLDAQAEQKVNNELPILKNGNNETTIMPIWSLGVLSLLQCLERRLFQDR
jgi:hypothetical protein